MAWVQTTSMPGVLTQHVTVRDAAGRIYAIGGVNGSGYTGDTFRLDPSGQTWSTLNSMAVPRHMHSAVVDSAGRIWVIGGFDGSYKDDVERFDPGTGLWTTMADLPVPLRRPGVIIDASDRIYVTGGYDGFNRNSVYRWNGASWDNLTSFSTARSGHAVALSATKLWVIGGRTAVGGQTAAIEEYSIAGNSWSASAQVLSSARQEALNIYDAAGRVYVIGGTPLSKKVDRFDPATGLITNLADMAVTRQGGGGALHSGGDVVVCGGNSDDAGALFNLWTNTVERFDPGAGTWTVLDPNIYYHFDHTAAFDLADNIYSIGGANIDSDFDPAVDRSDWVERLDLAEEGDDGPPPDEDETIVRPGVGFIPIDFH